MLLGLPVSSVSLLDLELKLFSPKKLNERIHPSYHLCFIDPPSPCAHLRFPHKFQLFRETENMRHTFRKPLPQQNLNQFASRKLKMWKIFSHTLNCGHDFLFAQKNEKKRKSKRKENLSNQLEQLPLSMPSPTEAAATV